MSTHYTPLVVTLHFYYTTVLYSSNVFLSTLKVFSLYFPARIFSRGSKKLFAFILQIYYYCFFCFFQWFWNLPACFILIFYFLKIILLCFTTLLCHTTLSTSSNIYLQHSVFCTSSFFFFHNKNGVLLSRYLKWNCLIVVCNFVIFHIELGLSWILFSIKTFQATQLVYELLIFCTLKNFLAIFVLEIFTISSIFLNFLPIIYPNVKLWEEKCNPMKFLTFLLKFLRY